MSSNLLDPRFLIFLKNFVWHTDSFHMAFLEYSWSLGDLKIFKKEMSFALVKTFLQL